MTDRAFFLKRVNDHLQYLQKINKTLENERCFQEASNCFKGTPETECNLGRWLYGEGAIEIGTMDNEEIDKMFDSLFEPHSLFHQASKEAMEKKQSGDHEGAKKAIAEMKRLSNLLTSKILKLEETLQQQGYV
jgi:hypothetical protein